MAFALILENHPSWVLDPTDKFRSEHRLPLEHIQEMVGLIPHFLHFGTEHGHTMREQLEKAYGFGTVFRPAEEFGAKLDEETHLYSYSGDPDMYPVGLVEHKGSKLRVYQYGICMLTDENGKQWWGRMD